MKIEDQLREYIYAHYKDLKQFAEAAGMPRTTLLCSLQRGILTTRLPAVYQICKELNIDMEALVEGKIVERNPNLAQLSPNESKLIEKYRTLDSYGVDAVDKIVSIEYNRNRFYGNQVDFCWKPLPDCGASAGLGNDLSDYGEMVKVPKNKVSVYADYVVRVVGDSMQPKYYDGDYVLVKSQPAIDVGETGIFILNNEGFIKELGEGCLISKNPKYDPMYITEVDELRCCGKVLEKTELLKE